MSFLSAETENVGLVVSIIELINYYIEIKGVIFLFGKTSGCQTY